MPMTGPVLARGTWGERTNGGANSRLQGNSCKGRGKRGRGGGGGRRGEGEEGWGGVGRERQIHFWLSKPLEHKLLSIHKYTHQAFHCSMGDETLAWQSGGHELPCIHNISFQWGPPMKPCTRAHTLECSKLSTVGPKEVRVLALSVRCKTGRHLVYTEKARDCSWLL